MRVRRWLAAALVLMLGTGLDASRASARDLSVRHLLDQYEAGAFDAVVDVLAGDVDFDDILKQLRRDGPVWIAAAGPEGQARRELVAATFALEAARAGAWLEWKLTQKQPKMCTEGPTLGTEGIHREQECYQPPSVLYWKAPPLLIEWGCELFRRDETPRPIERWWQLAALAVAERSEDPQFLIGDTNVGRGLGTAEIGNVEDEIKHLDHVTPRFPDEMRFVLAQGIARDRDLPDDARMVYEALRNHPDVGAEARMRLGALQLRRGDPSRALDTLRRADERTRDPYVAFLARYFSGQALERLNRDEQAEAAYRGAAAAIPHAQSATVALAALAFQHDRRTEAFQVVGEMLDADPPPVDPWRTFVHADDRFWPRLVGRLRAEIRR